MISELNVVLVRPTYSGNIGSAARAMANLGADKLFLIDPRCEIDNQARQYAAGAPEKLHAAVTYTGWAEFLADHPAGYLIALTRRTGRSRQPQPLREVLTTLYKQPGREASQTIPQPMYLIFGPEATGLETEDLLNAHRVSSLPVYGDFQSYNLAHAVLLSLYLSREAFPTNQVSAKGSQTRGAAVFPDELIKRWLAAMGFDWQKRGASAYLTMRRLLLQNWPTDQDLQVVKAILLQNIRLLGGAVDPEAKDDLTGPSA